MHFTTSSILILSLKMLGLIRLAYLNAMASTLATSLIEILPPLYQNGNYGQTIFQNQT